MMVISYIRAKVLKRECVRRGMRRKFSRKIFTSLSSSMLSDERRYKNIQRHNLLIPLDGASPLTKPRSSANESGGGCPGLPVPNSPYGLRGRKATLNLHSPLTRVSTCFSSLSFLCVRRNSALSSFCAFCCAS